MTPPSPHPSAVGTGGGTWDLAFIRVGTLVSAAVAVPAGVVVGVLLGWSALASVALGALLVAAFFAASGFTVAWAGRTFGDASTLPAALMVFGVKLMVLLALLQNLPGSGWIDQVVLGWSVFVGVVLWTCVQMRWVWTRKLYYSPPPAPPAQRS